MATWHIPPGAAGVSVCDDVALYTSPAFFLVSLRFKYVPGINVVHALNQEQPPKDK